LPSPPKKKKEANVSSLKSNRDTVAFKELRTKLDLGVVDRMVRGLPAKRTTGFESIMVSVRKIPIKKKAKKKKSTRPEMDEF
jgi:hypothetical protein